LSSAFTYFRTFEVAWCIFCQSQSFFPLGHQIAIALFMAGTDSTRTTSFGPAPRVVLVNPQLGENIGMAARAMANFGLFDLALVDPREGWDPVRAEAAASGAVETVKNATVHNSLEDCLQQSHYVYATTARPRDMTKAVMTPEQAGLDMRVRIGRGEKIAILFGRERIGLTNDEVSMADMIISAPVNPAYASLNIAQAVLLVSYEWFKHEATSLGQATLQHAALNGPGLQMTDTRLATKDELFGFYGHLEDELDTSGFFKTEKLKPSMVRNLRNLFARATLSEQEVRTLRGMISSLTRKHLRPKDGNPDG
jgi:tRNA/rRNA methyltransferase